MKYLADVYGLSVQLRNTPPPSPSGEAQITWTPGFTINTCLVWLKTTHIQRQDQLVNERFVSNNTHFVRFETIV